MKLELDAVERSIIDKYDRNVRGRAIIEMAIGNALIKSAGEFGYRLEVEGEDDDVSTPDALKLLLFNLDVATVLVFNGHGRKAIGWIQLVFGNGGYDLVSDYTTNLEAMLAPVNAVAEEWGG